MIDFESISTDEFFIIDSDNLNNVKTKLYGFFVDWENEKVITKNNFSKEWNRSSFGVYIYIDKRDNYIDIYQDFDGSYGLYVYQYQNNFCISNSFIYLVDYVKHKYLITLDKINAKAFFVSNLKSFTYKRTLINEIQLLPRNYIIHINLIDNALSYSKVDYNEKTISINSEEGISLLDDWFFRWTSLLRKLKKETNNIWIDLSGGFDSRGIFSLILSSKVNLNEIFIHSIDDNLHTHTEDFEIASEIANHYDFQLNNNIIDNIQKEYLDDIKTSIQLGLLIKLCFHNQIHFKTYKFKEPVYLIGGVGGELLRGYHMSNKKDYLAHAKYICEDLIEPTKEIIEYNEENIPHQEDFEYWMYRETESRFHTGKAGVEDAVSNLIGLHPYLDSELNKLKKTDEICDDEDLLIALIFIRYCPELLNFRFDGNREFDENTLNHAKSLNQKYPYINPFHSVVNKKNNLKENINISNSNTLNFNLSEINEYFKNIFCSYNFQKTFAGYFSSEIYEYALSFLKKSNYYNLQQAFTIFAVLKIIDDVKFNRQVLNKSNILTWFDGFLDSSQYIKQYNYLDYKKLLYYTTARIDIINYGKDSSINIIHISDKHSNIYDPIWFNQKNGYGKIIESYSNNFIDIKIKCINEGLLSIDLRGKDVVDTKGTKIPIPINYTKFLINNEIIINSNTLTWHDEPYVYTKKVIDGEIINIHIEWINLLTNE